MGNSERSEQEAAGKQEGRAEQRQEQSGMLKRPSRGAACGVATARRQCCSRAIIPPPCGALHTLRAGKRQLALEHGGAARRIPCFGPCWMAKMHAHSAPQAPCLHACTSPTTHTHSPMHIAMSSWNSSLQA